MVKRKKRPRRTRSWPLGKLLLAGLAAAVLGAAGLAGWIYSQFPGFPKDPPKSVYSTTIYAAPFRVDAGTSLPPSELRARLKRLGYEIVSSSHDLQPGEASIPPEDAGSLKLESGEVLMEDVGDPGLWTISLRGHDQPFWSMPPHVVHLHWEDGRIDRIVDVDNPLYQNKQTARLVPIQ